MTEEITNDEQVAEVEGPSHTPKRTKAPKAPKPMKPLTRRVTLNFHTERELGTFAELERRAADDDREIGNFIMRFLNSAMNVDAEALLAQRMSKQQ